VNRPASLLLFVAVIVATILVGGWLRTAYAPEWWPTPWPPQASTGLRPWPVEADCYSQLARVQRILHGQGLVQNHFTVENWPEGLIPSTTAPFDYVIILLWAPLALFTAYPLDWAGALVSPFLWLTLVAFWIFVRAESWKRAGRAALLVGMALAPSLVWATEFGRPRHQSLIVALLAVALTAEYERWQAGASRRWHIAAGILWGFLCWTSLYEPLFVVVLLVIFNFAARRRESLGFGISFGVVMLLALLIEGVHVFVPPVEIRPMLARWLEFIAEMRGMGVREFIEAITFSGAPELSVWDVPSLVVLLFLPWIAYSLWREKNLTDRFVMGLAIFLAGFAFFERRWLPYASLAEIFLLARYIQLAPLHGTRLLLGAAFLLNVSESNYAQTKIAQSNPPNQPSPELAEIARSIDQPGGVLAPWWLSPGLLYFSGNPIVSGSSHCGITGIVASARFFAATSWEEADQILRQRKVRWVVVWDEPKYVYPLLGSSQEILGEPASTDQDKGDADSTVAQTLVTDNDVPAELRLRAVTEHFKLYQVVLSPAASDASSSIHSPVAVR
jgi:hypothetical protein